MVHLQCTLHLARVFEASGKRTGSSLARMERAFLNRAVMRVERVQDRPLERERGVPATPWNAKRVRVERASIGSASTLQPVFT
jgi:hypothetical protein